MTPSMCPYEPEIGDSVMTNFDHSINSEVAFALKTEEAFSRYPGWNFNGRVWWDREAETWRCEVWCYGAPVAVLEAATLEEIMAQACERWGGE